jgi:hypothetical protein
MQLIGVDCREPRSKLAVVSILDSHRRDPGSIPCNVTFCPNLEIVTQDPNKHRGSPTLSLIDVEEEHINASYTDGQQSQDHTK